jgi:arylsulfatase A-like enzyme
MYEYGVAENTVILFTSDHGEMMGDHQYFRKCLPYEGSAKIPFILSDPHGLLKLKNNTSVDRPVELRDIMPTLLDAAQAAVPHTVEGKSLIPLARQEQVDWREYIHGEHTYGELSYHSVTDGEEKFIWFSQSGEEQFFDLVEDPEEKRNLNLHSEYQGRVVMWRERLIAELADREEGMSDGQRLIAGRKARPCLSHLNSV